MKDLDAKTLFPLIFSAIGGCAAVVSFTFLTFVSKSEAEVEHNHVQSEQQNIRNEIKQLNNTVLENQREMNQKLDRLLYYVKDHK